MLGLSNGLFYSTILSFKPSQLANLIGWWDFTDETTMYVDVDSYDTNVSSDGDSIGRIKNKCTNSNRLGDYLCSPADSKRPTWNTGGTPGYTRNRTTYGIFDGSDDVLIGRQNRDIGSGTNQAHFLNGGGVGSTSGDNTTAKFSDAVITPNNISVIIVAASDEAVDDSDANRLMLNIVGHTNSDTDDTGSTHLEFYQWADTITNAIDGVYTSVAEGDYAAFFKESGVPQDWIYSGGAFYASAYGVRMYSMIAAPGSSNTKLYVGGNYVDGTATWVNDNSKTIEFNRPYTIDVDGFSVNGNTGVSIGANLGAYALNIAPTSSQSLHFKGRIYEIIVINEGVSDTTRKLLHNYIRDKYYQIEAWLSGS